MWLAFFQMTFTDSALCLLFSQAGDGSLLRFRLEKRVQCGESLNNTFPACWESEGSTPSTAPVVGNGSARNPTCTDTREPTLEKSPVNALSMVGTEKRFSPRENLAKHQRAHLGEDAS